MAHRNGEEFCIGSGVRSRELVPGDLRWEDSETTKGEGLPLSPNFMWLIHPDDRDLDAVACISRDPEVYGDDLIHWDITDTPVKGISPSFDSAKREVEAQLGLPLIPRNGEA